jgi:hypothetical protein
MCKMLWKMSWQMFRWGGLRGTLCGKWLVRSLVTWIDIVHALALPRLGELPMSSANNATSIFVPSYPYELEI